MRVLAASACAASWRVGPTIDGAEQNKTLVLEAFDTLFNRPDYAAAQRFWSPDYIQHSAHIPAGRDGLFEFVKALPDDLGYENAVIVADGDYVITHGRFSSTGLPVNMIAADIIHMEGGLLAEHWDDLRRGPRQGVQKRAAHVRRRLPDTTFAKHVMTDANNF